MMKEVIEDFRRTVEEASERLLKISERGKSAGDWHGQPATGKFGVKIELVRNRLL